MGGARAAAVFCDPPYNLRVRAIGGRGRVQHPEFAFASGEMSQAQFRTFLSQTLGNGVRVSAQGAVHFVCIDWRHIGELIEVGRELYGDMLNIVVWDKSNAGQGSFYRSQHEFIGVFRVGEDPHRNNVELGRFGRNRSNVWTYAGVNTFGKGRMEALAAHPTVKPVALVADALLDCTARGDVVLDQFVGSGTTILAAEKVARIAVGIEYEPRYVDVAIMRWQHMTKLEAILAGDGRSFEDIAAARATEIEKPNAHRWKPSAGRSPPDSAAMIRARLISGARGSAGATSSNGERGHDVIGKALAPPITPSATAARPERRNSPPGKSGNPKGRPKGSRTVGAILQDILRQKIAVTENGKTRRMAALEVMLRRLVNDAMRSDAKAMKLLLALVDRYADSPEAERSTRRAAGRGSGDPSAISARAQSALPENSANRSDE